MNQTSFLPVKLTHQQPYEGTQDLALVGYTIDRIRYAVKRERDGEKLPLAEWIGYHLCRFCEIATPEFAVVECLEGDLAFGSRWEEHVTQITDNVPLVTACQLLAYHGSELSAIHCVDRFMVNPDRHAANYLFIIRAGLRSCLAMDFSMAGPRDAPPFGRHPLPPRCNTYQVISMLRDGLHRFDRVAYEQTIARLRSFDRARLDTVLTTAPDEWFASIQRSDLLDWWDNGASRRLSELSI